MFDLQQGVCGKRATVCLHRSKNNFQKMGYMLFLQGGICHPSSMGCSTVVVCTDYWKDKSNHVIDMEHPYICTFLDRAIAYT